MLSNLEFKAATANDLWRVVEIKLDMFRESGHFSLLGPHAADEILADYRNLYAQGKAQHFVAHIDGYIVASAGAFIKSDLPFRYFSVPCYGFIGDVYTETLYRGCGIATRLSRNALSWLKAQNVGMVRLLASNAGRSIYEKLGFVASDEMVLMFNSPQSAS